MKNIITTFVPDKDLTVHRAEGKVLAADIISKIDEYYSGNTVSKKVLWDFSGADASGIESDEVREIARLTRKYADIRKGGRTALVFSGDLEFGLGRMFTAFSRFEETPYEFGCFRSLEKAKEWLG